MNKIMVEIFVPIAEKKYDILLPTNIDLYTALNLIGKAITDISEGLFIMDTQTVLCSKEDGVILDINLSVYESGIKNGSKLILI